MRSFVMAAVSAALFLFSAAAAGQAAEMKAEGVAIYSAAPPTQTVLSSSDEGRDVTIAQLRQSGILHDDDEASPLNLSAHDCTGTLVTRAGKTSGAGSCMAADKDGDVWWLAWTSDGQTKGTWEAIAGTGKYEGIAGSGTTTFIASFPDRNALRYSGTLTLK